jgi:prepilin-type N-terminal cleavage/methylation domain-containing protein
MKRTNRSGFTLVEVLTVIAIIALLAALILGLAGNAQKKAARTKAESEIAQLQSFVTDYQMQYGQAPTNVAALSNALKAANHALVSLTDPWGAAYQYERSSPATFYLWSKGGATNVNPAQYIGNPKPGT